MFFKINKIVAFFIFVSTCSLNANNFQEQAQKDRLALIKYFETKFKEPLKNKIDFFPYASDEEIKKSIKKGVKFEEFSTGSYSFNIDGKAQYDAIKEMPPYDEDIEEGEILYNKKFKNGKSFKACFKSPIIVHKYPYYDTKKDEVITLTIAINNCLIQNNEKKWNPKKGKLAKLQAYFAYETTQNEKIIDIQIPNEKARQAYERGKEYYYSQKGYLKVSCATCHVQGAGQRVRNEKLSPLLGHTTHFPVYRLKWDALGTLERRVQGCIKDEGQVPPKVDSKEMKELIYFMSYMSNGMKIDGPDIRK